MAEALRTERLFVPDDWVGRIDGADMEVVVACYRQTKQAIPQFIRRAARQQRDFPPGQEDLQEKLAYLRTQPRQPEPEGETPRMVWMAPPTGDDPQAEAPEREPKLKDISCDDGVHSEPDEQSPSSDELVEDYTITLAEETTRQAVVTPTPVRQFTARDVDATLMPGGKPAAQLTPEVQQTVREVVQSMDHTQMKVTIRDHTEAKSGVPTMDTTEQVSTATPAPVPTPGPSHAGMPDTATPGPSHAGIPDTALPGSTTPLWPEHPQEEVMDFFGAALRMNPRVMSTRTISYLPRGTPVGIMLPRAPLYVRPDGSHIGFHTGTVVLLDEPIAVTRTNAWVPRRPQDLEALEVLRQALLAPDRPDATPNPDYPRLYPHQVVNPTAASMPRQPRMVQPATFRPVQPYLAPPESFSTPAHDPPQVSSQMPAQMMEDDDAIADGLAFAGRMMQQRHLTDQLTNTRGSGRVVSPTESRPGTDPGSPQNLAISFKPPPGKVGAATDVVTQIVRFGDVTSPTRRATVAQLRQRPPEMPRALLQPPPPAPSTPKKELDEPAAVSPGQPSRRTESPDLEVASLTKEAGSLHLQPE